MTKRGKPKGKQEHSAELHQIRNQRPESKRRTGVHQWGRLEKRGRTETGNPRKKRMAVCVSAPPLFGTTKLAARKKNILKTDTQQAKRGGEGEKKLWG